MGCINLKSINISNSVKTLSRNLFTRCDSLTSVTIPESVTAIESEAFDFCQGLTGIMIPKTVTEIGPLIFFGCASLATIVVEKGNPRFDSRNNCNAIVETSTNTLICGCKNTVIPNTVSVIGEYAFYGCEGLERLFIPDGVTTIASYAFYGTHLSSLIIPKTVTSISAMMKCRYSGWLVRGLELVKIEVDKDNPKYDSRSNCNAIMETSSNTLVLGCKNTIIPDTTVVIGAHAFDGCYDLESVIIPSSVTEIRSHAFYECESLKEVIIPRSVLKIGERAFRYCRSLKKVIILNPKTEYITEGDSYTFDSSLIVEEY